jgi:hypothetical protein
MPRTDPQPVTTKLVGPATMRPHCTECGNYLLPCTKTASGIHPIIVGVSVRTVEGSE